MDAESVSHADDQLRGIGTGSIGPMGRLEQVGLRQCRTDPGHRVAAWLIATNQVRVPEK
jgi:hypothetical protein